MEQLMYPPFENLRVETGDREICLAKIAWDVKSVLPVSAPIGESISCFVALDTPSVIGIEEKVAAGESVENIQLIGTQKADDEETEIIVAEIDLNADYVQSECNLVVPALKQQVQLAEESAKKSDKRRALELCLCANIISKFTSLIAVEKLPAGGIVEASAMPVLKQKVPETVAEDIGEESLIRGDRIFSAIDKRQFMGDQVGFGIGIYSDSEDDVLGALEKLRNIDGSYDLSSELAELVGNKNLGDKAEIPGFTAALAIVLMETRLAALKADWKLLHKKATKDSMNSCRQLYGLLEHLQ